MSRHGSGRSILVLGVVAMTVFLSVGVAAGASAGIEASSSAGNSGGETVTDCRQLNESGLYELGGNITADATEECLFVNASDVIVHGNGHWLNGSVDGGAHGHPIAVQGSPTYPDSRPGKLSNVTLRNVRVANWSQPVVFNAVENATVVDSVLRDGFNVGGTRSGNGLQINDGSNATVVETRVTGFPGRGIELFDVANATVTRTAVVNNGYQGVMVNDGDDNAIRNNTIVGNAHNARGGSAIQSNGPLAGLTIRDNNVSYNNGNGMKLGGSEGGLIANNTVRSNNHGILLHSWGSGNNTIRDNTVADSYRVGIYPRVPHTVVEDNRVVDSGSHGINFRPSINGDASFGVARNNTVRRSDSDGIVVNSARNVSLVENRVANSTGNGLLLQGDVPELRATGNLFTRNKRGISVKTDTASGTVERNGFVNNSQWGAHFLWDAVETLNLEHNIITGNGDRGVIYRQDDDGAVSATNNWWGHPSGPASPGNGNLTDPETGAVANGTGDVVSENGSTGVANVRFDPWLETPPTVPFRTEGPSITTDTLPHSKLGADTSSRIDVRSSAAVDSFAVVNGSLPAGLELHDDGVVNGTAGEVGTYTFTVRVTDADNATANRTLTKRVSATIPQADLEIEKEGGRAVPGRKQLYLIRLTNTGDTVATNLSIEEYLEPWFTFAESNPEPDSLNTTTTYNGTAAGFDDDLTRTTIRWNLSDLQPGESHLLTYQARLDDGLPDGMTVTGEACASDGTPCDTRYRRCRRVGAQKCDDEVGALAQASKVQDCLTGSISECIASHGLDSVQSCKDAVKGACKARYQKCKDLKQTENLRGDEHLTPPCAPDENQVDAATDPNEKIVGTDRYITPNTTLPYVVHFENVGNGTATNVTITDRLPDALNLSSVEVFTADRTRVSLNASDPATLLNRSRTRTRNVTLGNETVTRTETVVERHTASLDGRTVEWHMQNVDLAPNETGSVLFSSDSADGVADGTRIENDATIEFDEVSSLTTDDTLNIVDRTAPSCQVSPLPARSPRTVTLSWTGADPTGEIDYVSLFVSSDGGETWETAAAGLENETTSFRGELGEDYRFMCTAVDTAGNRETQTPSAEAKTTVAAVNVTGTVREADGDPAVADTVTVADATRGFGPVVVEDWNGTVCRLIGLDGEVVTDGAGRFDLTTETGLPKELSYYQAHPATFPQRNGTAPTDAEAFPRDGSPDLFGLARLTPTGDVDLGTERLPDAHPVNVTVVTESGPPVENASLRVQHTAETGARAAIVFPNATTADGRFVPGASDTPGVEVTGNVSIAVLVPNESRYDGRFYARSLDVDSARNLTIRVNETDDSPPVIERFDSSRDPRPVGPDAPTTITVDLDDETPGDATLSISRNGTTETVFERDVSAAFDDRVSFEWNGTNDTGAPLRPGRYDLVLTARDALGHETTRKLTVTRRGSGDEKREDPDNGNDGSNGNSGSSGNGGSGGAGGGSGSGSAGGGGYWTGPDDPAFAVEGTVASRLVAVGDQVAIDATVRNTGDATGEFDLGLVVDGEVTGANRTGELDADEETTLQFRYNATEPGVRDLRVGEADLDRLSVVDGVESVADAPIENDTATFTNGTVDGVEFHGEQSGVVSVAHRAAVPDGDPSPEGPILAVFEIHPEAADDASATVRFGLARSALDDADVASEDVELLHYAPESGEWEPLETRVERAGTDRVEFAADSTLSRFAAVGRPAGDQQNETETPTEQNESETPREPTGTVTPITEPGPAADLTPAPDGTASEDATTDGEGTGFGFAAVLVAIALLVTVATRRRP
ncbi:right-handed parallel beta-helix repeat-containing protein [Halorientalis halophila]|uniref:right-handed parallel beta-helix repeat-containing protein n=1 Tax=Halorientalis halophila TaxID=3108499 RepID=UPI0030090920